VRVLVMVMSLVVLGASVGLAAAVFVPVPVALDVAVGFSVGVAVSVSVVVVAAFAFGISWSGTSLCSLLCAKFRLCWAGGKADYIPTVHRPWSVNNERDVLILYTQMESCESKSRILRPSMSVSGLSTSRQQVWICGNRACETMPFFVTWVRERREVYGYDGLSPEPNEASDIPLEGFHGSSHLEMFHGCLRSAKQSH
jgi:hypothetical protein